MKKLMLGNEAIARGLYEAGCDVISSYPGTPSTEITEFAAKYKEIYCEWAPNEKVALEAAYGASLYGKRAACAMKHVGLNVAADPLFTLSYTGVGGGLVIGGKLQTGMGMGGEVGHMVIVHNGAPCNCGRKGCWERYASATALVQMTKEAMEQHPDSRMHAVAKELGGVDGRTSFTAAEQGDPAALDVCSRYVSYLAAGVTNLVNMLQPEKLALGGGVSDAPAALLLEPLRRTVAEECIGRHAGVYTEIVKAELGNDAGIIGAAMLHRAVR